MDYSKIYLKGCPKTSPDLLHNLPLLDGVRQIQQLKTKGKSSWKDRSLPGKKGLNWQHYPMHQRLSMYYGMNGKLV
jgi:hypothetical protein